MNFLLFLMLLSLSGSLALGCARKGGKPTDGEVGTPMQLNHIEISGIRAHNIPIGNYVFRNWEEWRNFWVEYHEPPVPEVDLKESALLLAVLGQKPNPGYSVRISKALNYQKEVVVHVTEYLPSPELRYVQIIVFPFDVALIPKTQKEIRFDTSQKVGPPSDIDPPPGR